MQHKEFCTFSGDSYSSFAAAHMEEAVNQRRNILEVKILAILDELRYSIKLMESFCEKKNLGFQVRVFSNVEELEYFAKKNQLEILLITGRMMSERIQQFNIGKIILLSDGEIYEKYSDYETIYKYQSAEKILKEILCYYAEYAKPAAGMFFGTKEFEVYGVYSPVGRCGKSALARALAGKHGKKKRTLLLDLQSFSAYPEQLGEEELWDLADIIYFLRQGKKTFLYKLGSIVRNQEFYDYILPMKTPADLRSVTLAEWTELLEKLSTDSDYQTVILDFGNDISGLFGLLNQCKKVYVPMLLDEYSKRKMRNFEVILRDENFERVIESIEKIVLPTGVQMISVNRFMEEWTERNVML